MTEIYDVRALHPAAISVEDAAVRIRDRLGAQGRVTVLSGAGISTESGLKSFRGVDGLWEKYRLEDVATAEAFARDPEKVLTFYNERRRQLRGVEPNLAHRALARLEQMLGDRFTLITQNVDDLHERAGSMRVLHMHGELMRARCTRCWEVVRCAGDINLADVCHECGGHLRPHVVWFGEVPFYLDEEIPEALRADVFLSIGSSGTVYPAAGFVATAKENGALAGEINLEPSQNAELFDLHVLGPAGMRVPHLVDLLVGFDDWHERTWQ